MKRITTTVTMTSVCLAVLTAMLVAQTTAGPTVKPTAVVKKAGASSPAPATATKTKTAGKNDVKMSTANHATDDDSFWIEQIDVDGDGDVEDSNLVWDDEDGMLFAQSSGTFACKNGGTAVLDVLTGVNAANNPRKRPAGSGFWVADLDKGECSAQADALWGCRFDAKGVETACGIVTLDEKNDDIVIVTATR